MHVVLHTYSFVFGSAGSLLLPLALGLLSGAGATSARPGSLDPAEALRQAAANEEKAKAHERDFSYRKAILVQTFGEAGTVRAQLQRVSEMGGYDDLGNRIEKVLSAPPSPLTNLFGTQQPDFKVFLGVDPFFLTTDGLARHSIKFVAREKIDELETLAFELEPKDPKKFARDNRPFKGKVWIDERDLQMVKCEGRAVTTKDDRERFPKFEYYRENVESNLWLPSVVIAKDVLDLERYDLPIKIEIKYTSYKRIKPRR
ncbi:MAG: hypothetical protein AABO41_22065 [Acidobacteriota bacterium]